jgi:hypothetical protein
MHPCSSRDFALGVAHELLHGMADQEEGLAGFSTLENRVGERCVRGGDEDERVGLLDVAADEPHLTRGGHWCERGRGGCGGRRRGRRGRA